MKRSLFALSVLIAVLCAPAFAIKGFYQVGDDQPVLKKLTDVANLLDTATIDSATIFELNATYDGATGETFPIVFHTRYPVSGYTYVWIRPDSGVSMRTTAGDPGSGQALITLDSTLCLYLDGRPDALGDSCRWTIRNTRDAATVGPTIQLVNGAAYNYLYELQIEGQNDQANSGTLVIGTSGAAEGNRYNSVYYCRIRDRSDAASPAPANGFYCAGTPGTPNYGNVFNYCDVFNFSATGIFFDSTGCTGNDQVERNYVYDNRSTPPATMQTAIRYLCSASAQPGYIFQNYIGGSDQFWNGTWTNAGNNMFTAIAVRGSTQGMMRVTDNWIANIELTNTGSAAAFYGILIQGGKVWLDYGNWVARSSVIAAGNARSYGVASTSPDSVIIENVYISDLRATGTGTTAAVTGIYHTNSTMSPVIIRHNAIFGLSTTSTATSTSPTAAAVNGIVTSSPSTSQTIEGNLVTGLGSAPGTAVNTTVNGIGVSSSASAGVIRANRINGLTNASTGTAPAINGINAYWGNWTAADNMIYLTNGANTNPVVIRGMWDNDLVGRTWRFEHNTVLIGGTASSGALNSYAFCSTVGTTDTLRNNILFNARSGGTEQHYTISRSAGSAFVSDYNLLVCPRSTAVAQMAGSTSSFSGWRSSYGLDLHSWADTAANIAADSLFDHAGSGLHIRPERTECWYVSGKGMPLAYDTLDFDDSLRSASVAAGATDIGADEFAPGCEPHTLTITPTAGGIDTIRFAGRDLAILGWPSGEPSSLDLKYYSGEWPPATYTPGAHYSNGWWDISESGGPWSGASLSLCYDPAMLGTVTPEDSAILARYHTPTWWFYTDAVVDIANDRVVKANLSEFGAFALTDRAHPLAVETGKPLPVLPATRLGTADPNPFSGSTRIRYQLSAPGRVSLKVYNLAGQLVRTLVDGEMPAGSHAVRWDGRTDDGRGVAAGLFLYRLQANGFNGVKKMVMIR